MINAECPEQVSLAQRAEAGSPNPVRILVCSRYPMMLAGVRVAIARQYPAASVDCVTGLADIDQRLAAAGGDLLVLHLSHASAGQRADLQQLRRSHPGTKILLIAPYGSRDMVLWSLDAGAHGVVIPSATPSQFQDAIRSVMAGCIYVPPIMATLHSAGSQTARGTAHRVDPTALTPRQLQVLQLLAEGRSNKEIARKLGLALGTVKVHVGHLFATLGVSSRVEAIIKAGTTRGTALNTAL